MFLYSYIYIHLKTKSFFWFGIIIGILISLNYSTDDDNLSSCMDYINVDSIGENKIEFPIETKVNLAKKPLIPKKLVKPIVRPRYYSTELGIREKLFVGVLTSFENLDSVGISINVSIGQYVNKVNFFRNKICTNKLLHAIINLAINKLVSNQFKIKLRKYLIKIAPYDLSILLVV